MAPDKPELTGVAQLIGVVARLRGEGGCPWDRKQTLDTLRSYLLEEAYELLDALDTGDPDLHREEMGDVLLQLVLQARIREENAEFTFDDVARALSEKLIRRHPHVFGDTEADTPEAVVQNWEAIKAKERRSKGHGTFDTIPQTLPALLKAHRVQSRASRVGFDWPGVEGPLDKLREEIDELSDAVKSGDPVGIEEELGDLLFAMVNVSRFLKVNAEEALRASVRKFIMRFEAVERRVVAQDKALADCTLEELDAHWNAVKSGEI